MKTNSQSPRLHPWVGSRCPPLAQAPAPAAGAPTPPASRSCCERIRTDAKAVVVQNLKLTEAESKAFWPAYDECHVKLDRRAPPREPRHPRLRDAATTSRTPMRGRIAKDLVAAEIDESRAMRRVSTVSPRWLPGKKAARFLQIESRCARWSASMRPPRFPWSTDAAWLRQESRPPFSGRPSCFPHRSALSSSPDLATFQGSRRRPPGRQPLAPRAQGRSSRADPHSPSRRRLRCRRGAALLPPQSGDHAGRGISGRRATIRAARHHGRRGVRHENGSKGGGIGPPRVQRGPAVRYAAGAAYDRSISRGTGCPASVRDRKRTGSISTSKPRWRLPTSAVASATRNGGRAFGMSARIRKRSFALRTPAEIPQRQFDATISGLGLVAEYDARDNIFTPNSGLRAYLQAMSFDETARQRPRFQQAAPGPQCLLSRGRFGGGRRSRRRAIRGRRCAVLRTPPSLSARHSRHALPGDRPALAEIEARWNLDGRWSLVGFAGAGRAAGTSGDPWLGSQPG